MTTFSTTLLRQLSFVDGAQRVLLFVCTLVLATLVSPQQVLAQQTGYLNIHKSVTNANGSYPSGTVFRGSATCSNGSNYAANVTTGMVWSTKPTPYGTSCTITEPTLPPPFTNAQGQTCTWQQQPPLSQTVTINAPTQSVTVTNSFTCTGQTGYLNIYKSVTNAKGSYPSGTGFTLSATCSNGYTQTLSITTATVWSLKPTPYGASCTITEPTLPAPFTNAQGQTCTWQQQPPLSQTVTINAPAQSVTVTNSFTCTQQTGHLNIHKSVTNAKGSYPSGTQFYVSATCSNGYYHAQSITTYMAWSTIPIPYGKTCTIKELALPPPFTNAQGQTCTWHQQPPLSQTVSINAPTRSVTVKNSFTCTNKTLTGSLSVTKLVSPDPAGIGIKTQFPIAVTCTDPSSVSTSYPLTVQGGTSHVPITNLTVGTKCTTNEIPPGSFQYKGQTCTWQLPTYSPQPVTISAGMNHVTVTNSYTCVQQYSYLIITKVITGTAPVDLTKTSFTFNGVCTTTHNGVTGTFSVSNPFYMGEPYYSTCSQLWEALPLPAPFSYSSGNTTYTCTWDPPKPPSPAPPYFVNSPTQRITFTNSYTCH
jgi:hypothetical protein